MTVALGPKGNNLILGGKLSQVSAEDAYTVGCESSSDQAVRRANQIVARL
jgi:sterol 14-demethylase